MGKIFRPLPAQNPVTVASRRPYYLFCTSGQTRKKDKNSDKTKVNDNEKHIRFQAEGKPDPEILWFKHDAPVTQSSSVKVSFLLELQSEFKSQKLTGFVLILLTSQGGERWNRVANQPNPAQRPLGLHVRRQKRGGEDTSHGQSCHRR